MTNDGDVTMTDQATQQIGYIAVFCGVGTTAVVEIGPRTAQHAIDEGEPQLAGAPNGQHEVEIYVVPADSEITAGEAAHYMRGVRAAGGAIGGQIWEMLEHAGVRHLATRVVLE